MKSIKLVIVFILLINILLTESFESKNDLVSNNIKSIDNLQQPAILNDEEDMKSIEKRQSKSKKSRRRKRKNKQTRIQQIRQALTQLQSQIASIATRLDSLTTTARPNGRR
uniref:BZIP domain-containing protein n=1 Tax=Strongyloides papillosus TaxID=174720 RepID=A0A0N5BQW7_STREA